MGNKAPSYEAPDFLKGSPEYGVMLIEVFFNEQPQKNNQNINQVVLEFPILPKSGLVLNQKNDSYKFNFRISFSKDAFQNFFENLEVLIHYSNTSDSSYDNKLTLKKCMDGVILPITQNLTLQNSKLNTSLGANFSYAIIGNNIVNDFCKINFEPYVYADFRNHLEKLVDLVDSQNFPFYSEEHLASLKFFGSPEAFNGLMEGFNKRNLVGTEESEVFLKYVNKVAESLNDVNFNTFWKIMHNGFYDSAKMNYRRAFYKVLESVRKKTHLRPKAIIDLLFSLEELEFYENKNQIAEVFFADSWIFDNLLLPEFQSKNDDFSNLTKLLKYLISNYWEIIDDYLKKNVHKLEKKINLPQNNIHYHYLMNLLESPEFHQIDLRVLRVYEQNKPYEGPEIQDLVRINGPAYRIKELNNIVIISEHVQKLTMHITHTFLMGLNFMDIFPARTAIFFLSDTLPEISNFQKFYDITFEQFQKGEIPKDDTLVPIALVDIQKKPVVQDRFGEAQLEKVASGKYFSAIVLEGKLKDYTPQTKAIGCYGFLDKENAEKYLTNLLEKPFNRLHIYWRSKNLHGDAAYSKCTEKEIMKS